MNLQLIKDNYPNYLYIGKRDSKNFNTILDK